MSQQLDEEAVFHIARKLADLDDREQYLHQICAGDQQLRGRVEALLDVHEKEQEFLKSSPDATRTAEYTSLTERPGATIGRYKLMEQLGEGGMGTVFVAQQDRPIRRKVALKVIKPGMDSRAIVARFEAERQALAMMDHPNIAKVLDAGTTDSGRPYFAMELVKGIPITDYCDRNRLTIRERLELFIQVCQAIQHAHQKGIIHRDIKPSNVLVTLHDGKPVPKVIDFGVAKALNTRLTDKTVYTEHMQIVGTLLYMSPEQAELSGLDIDTRSDVYSLGVLLYELLTGTTPFTQDDLNKAGFDQQRRMIREQEPPRASVRISSLGDTATTVAEHRQTDPKRLNQAISGELDWIVLRSLEKDRTRRYETVNGLAADVERFLNGDAVEACPPTLAYRLQKFTSRNRAVLTTGVLIGMSLLLGLGLAIWQAQLAGHRAGEAEELLDRLNISLFDQGFSDVFSGNTDAASTTVDTLRDQNRDDLADKLQAVAWIFEGEIEAAIDLLSSAHQQHPADVGLLAMLNFAYNGNGDFVSYWDSLSELEDLLDTPESIAPKSAADHMFVASAFTLDSTRGVEHAEQAFKQHRQAGPLLWRGRLQADCAMHCGDREMAREAIEDLDAARRILGNSVPVRIDGLSGYLLAANAMKSDNDVEGYDETLQHAEALVLEFPNVEEQLPWERLYLAEYHYERNKPGEVRKLLLNMPTRGVSDYDSYLALALALGLEGNQEVFEALTDNDTPRGPFCEAGMAIVSSVLGKRKGARETAERLLSEHDIVELVLLSLDVMVLAGVPASDIQRSAADKLSKLRTRKLDTWSRQSVDHILPVYAANSDEEPAVQWAEDSNYPKLWLTHAHWAIGMRSLARRDFESAKLQLESVVAQRVIYTGPFLWARALLANWDDVVTTGPLARDERKTHGGDPDESSDSR